MTGLRAKQNKVLWLPVSINQDSLNTKSFGITETLCQSFQIDLFSTRATIHERQTRNRDSLNIPSRTYRNLPELKNGKNISQIVF